MDTNGRILSVMAHYKLTKSEFAQRIHVSQGVLSHISNGRNNAGLEMVVSILNEFPEISPEWLVLGKGGMLKSKQDRDQIENLSKLIDEVMLVNNMNYNSLNQRIETLKERLKQI